MKTKISRISRRTVAMVLSVLMLVSVLGLGSLITASAWTFNTTYLHISFDNGTNWTDYKIGDSAGSFTLNESKTCKWLFCCEGTWYSDKGDSKPYSSGTFNNTSSGNYYYAKTGGSDYSATLPAGNYTFNFTNRYDNNATLQYVFYYSELTYPVTVVNGNGTSTINVGSSGQSVTAAAKGGYTFTGWTATGSCTVNNGSSSNSATVTVRATGTGGTVTANYTEATAPENVVAGTDIMFYIQGYEGFNKLGNPSKALGGSSTRVGETNVSYVQIAKSSAGSYQYITNNPGNWPGVKNSNIGESSAGKKHVAAGSTSTTNATTATTTLSSSSISSGTASITLNTTCSATTSSNGATLYYQYYLDGTLVSGSTTKAKTTSQSFALDTSSLSTASHTLKTIATDGYIFYIADTDTITVTNPTYDVTIGTVNNGSISSDKSKATSGEKVTLTLSPSTGYNPVAPTITKAGGGTVTPAKVSNTSYTFTMPSQAVTVTATFTQKTYAITFSETGGSGTLKIDGTVRTSGYAVTHGSHTFRVEAPDGYIISSITGIDTWTNNDTYATLGSTSITSTKTISVTYAVAGTPTLDTIAAVANKNVNNTTFTFPVSVSDRSKASGTLTLQVTSGNTNIITIQNSPYTVSADTTNINATVAGVATGNSTITVKLYDGSTLLDTKTVSINVTAPSFTLTDKDVYVSSKNSAITKSTSPAPSSISWSSNNTEYITVNSDGQVTAVKVPTSDQTATITATATYASGYTKTVTCTATLHTPNLSATTTAASGTIGTTATGGVTASYPNSDQIASYSWSSNASTTVAVTNGTTSAPTFTFKKPGSATITLTATYKNTGLTKTATVSITVTQPTCSFTDSSAIALGIGQTQTRSANVSAVGSAATTTLEYSGSNSYITVASDTGAVTGVKPTSSAQTVTATYTITCGGQTTTKTATYNVTVTTPTVSITSGASVNVDADLSLAASSSGATTSPTYTWSVTNGTGTASVSGSTLTGLTPGTVTVKVSATYGSYTLSNAASKTVTVNTPSISMSNVTIAKGDKVTLSATTSNPSGLTMAYELASAVSGVTISGNKLSVTGDCSASSATIVAKAKNSAGTVVATKNNVSVTIQDPSLTIADTANESTKYLTVGTNYAKTLTSNFSGTYTATSSNTSAATVSVTGSTLTVVPVAKGTSTITVTHTKAAAQITASSAGKSKSLSKGKLATGAAGDITATQTFTVNVAEAEDYKLILFTDNYSWGSAYIYYNGKGQFQMTKIGKNASNQDVYGYRMPIADWNSFSYVVFAKDTSWSTQTRNVTDKDTGYYISGDGSGVKDRTAGHYTHEVVVPQVTIDDATTPLGTNYTLTATKVTSANVGEYNWSSATTSVATVTADTNTTPSTTVVPVDAGTSVVTVTAFAAAPSNWSLTYSNATASVIGSTDTATMTVTADDRTVTYSAKASYDHSDYDSHDGEGGTITTSPNVASGGTVAHGTNVTFTATPSSGYKFVGWRVGTGSNEFTTSAKTIRITSDTQVYALFDRVYTLTINNENLSYGTVSENSVEVLYNGTPASFTVEPTTGYKIDYSNCTNLNKYYTIDSSQVTGEVTFTGKNDVAVANKTNATITIAFEEVTPVVNFTSYKTDDGTTYVAGGGELTAAWTTSGSGSGSGSGGGGTASSYYVHYNKTGSDYPSNYSTHVNMIEYNNKYYATIDNASSNTNVYFNINTNSSSSTPNSYVLYGNGYTATPQGGVTAFNIQNYGSNDKCYVWANQSNYTKLYVILDTTNKNLTVTTTDPGVSLGGGSGGGSSSETSGTVVSGGTVPYTADVTFTAEASATVGGETYQFIGWYSTAQPEDEEEALSTTTTYTKTNVTSDVNVYAIYKKSLYLTFYNSYVQDETTREFNFTAAPPRTVKVGMGESVRATYTYKAGNEEQRGEEHTKNSTSDYYEGNRLLVLVGETVTLEFSTLASSDAISGIFFNNSLRYTTETEPDNLYKQRVKYTGEDPKCWGAEGDDEWDYTYLPDTTLYADENYYTGATASTITSNASSYKLNQSGGSINQNTHTVTWVATQSYLNIDIELGTKYQLHINEDKYDGINIANMNDEGYYYAGEAIESVTPDHTNGLKITLDNTTDTSGTYSFTSTTPTWKDKDGNTVDAPSGVYATPYKSDNKPLEAQDPISSIDHWIVYGTMPASDLYLVIPVAKKYNMKLSNIVVSDNGSSKKTMLTECGSNSTSATDSIGTISGKVDGTAQAALTDDGTYFTYDGNNNAGHVEVYTDGSSSNNRYLNGGVCKNGYNVTAGQTVSYTFEWNTGKDAEYSFVGWFEGKLVDNTDYKFEPDYNKKLSGKESFTFTPTKNTIVMAVATRDVYIGGNFTSDGAYASSTGNTWASGRPLMDFDPTYVNPEDPTKKGRYTYTFDSVTANTEYQFRCYDTASGTATTNLSVWNQWGKGDYATDADDVFYGRHQYADADGKSHGQFVYKNNTNNWSLIDNTASDHDSNKNHAANGYAAPVTVYFYAYDGGMSVAAEYQWSRAYVSEGRGIDVKSVSGNTTTYNAPTASVANKTVNNKDVTVTTNTTSYGHDGMTEKIHECLVKEKNGSIVVTASPADENLELQAFLVYNIETKTSESVKEFTKSGSGDSATYTGNIPIPNNSKIYVCPIYKFTDAYISAQNLESHNVFVRADEIDKDDWGGLVSMYSWGTASGYDSGGWPGQLMIPSDDGSSFYAPLTFQKGGLAGVTFTNYTPVNGGDFINFLGKYQDAGVSDVAYSNYTKPSAANNYQYQVFDYREPISIIENLNETNPKIYDSEDMTLTFALKPGNKASGTVGNGSYNANHNFEYLTDSSGKYRVDLNGNKLSTNPTASYYIVCNYTEDYKPGGSKTYDFEDGDRDGTSAHNRYSIDWNVYDQNHQLVTNGTMLSASFTDVHKAEMLTHVAKKLIDDGQPVSGKSVMIAYENPKVSSSDNTEAVRYSGQWYADSTNTIIKGNVRVGILSDGAFIPSETNAPGYATATVGFTPNTTIGEKLSTETGCTGNSLAEITKIHASNGDLQYTVSTKDNFEGWYRKTKDGDFEPIGSNYKSQTINPSFNEDITYYAFYSASASYRVKYTGRDGSTKYFTAKGSDLTSDELAANGILDDSKRTSDINTKLAKATTDISVFNKSYDVTLSSPTKTAYTLTYDATQSATTYALNVYYYNSSGAMVTTPETVSGTWGTEVSLDDALLANKPEGAASSDVFIGWKRYTPSGSAPTATDENSYVSTNPNFGYTLTEAMTIAPVFGTVAQRNTAMGGSWNSYVDKNQITQELTDENTGKIYNDNLLRFQFGANTQKMLYQDGYSRTTHTMDISDMPNNAECGFLIVAQDADSKKDYGDTFTDSTDAKYLSDARMKTYANYMRTNSYTSAKLSAASYGNTYAYRVKVNSLSRLNRAHIFQALDYAKFNGGNYKVMAYYYDGTNSYYSDVKPGTYTYPAPAA